MKKNKAGRQGPRGAGSLGFWFPERCFWFPWCFFSRSGVFGSREDLVVPRVNHEGMGDKAVKGNTGNEGSNPQGWETRQQEQRRQQP